jgi:hypothetical protein
LNDQGNENHDEMYCSQEKHMDDYEELIYDEHNHVDMEKLDNQMDEK